MNNRYLYRAKHMHALPGNEHLDWKWIEGYLSSENCIFSTALEGDFLIDPSTICQCTGLKDKNGKLIWENDVVCTPYVDPIFGDIVNDEILDDYTWKVVFVDGGFCVENEDKIINLRSFTNGNHIKAIGNIFDNPELLEK